MLKMGIGNFVPDFLFWAKLATKTTKTNWRIFAIVAQYEKNDNENREKFSITLCCRHSRHKNKYKVLSTE
jgi:hypothetical protein